MWYNTNNNELIRRAKAVTVNEVQYSSDIFRLWSEAERNAIGIYRLVETAQPVCTAVQGVREVAPVLVLGIPTQAWEVYDMFTDTASYTTPEGVVVPAKTKLQNETEYLAKLQADAMAQLVQKFTDVTTAYIEAKVKAYNLANGLAFKDIDAFTKYAITPTSTHNAIAVKFIEYADRLWSAVRTYQSTATVVPTDEEFKAILDGVVF